MGIKGPGIRKVSAAETVGFFPVSFYPQAMDQCSAKHPPRNLAAEAQASLEKTGAAAPFSPWPAAGQSATDRPAKAVKRPTQEVKEAPAPAAAIPMEPRLCPDHGTALKQDTLGGDYCPTCRRERLRKNQPPVCETHGCKKAENKRGNWYCEKCRVAAQRRRWERERKMKEEKDGLIPKCPQHPEREQHLGKKGSYRGKCLPCLQDQARNSARKRKANNAARKVADPGEKKEILTPLPGKIEALKQTESARAKLPDLDPSWPDEIKGKWFDIFQKIVELDFLQAGRQAGRQAGTLSLLTNFGKGCLSTLKAPPTR